MSAPLSETWPYWLGFHLIVAALLVLDLGVLSRDQKPLSKKAAAAWSAVWVSLSMGFAFLVHLHFGPLKAQAWLTAYLLEKALSVDNLFVFLLIFGYFKVPLAMQHRVLSFGIMGAIVLRASMIGAGVLLIKRFDWLLVLFGLFLVYSAAKLLFVGDDVDEDLENNRVVAFFRRFVPMTDGYDGGRFWTRVDGKRLATPLLLVLFTIEISDVIFAVDSIPAVFGVSLDGFIIYTSNIFAILGLRALYFLLASALDSMRFLGPAVALILGVIGVEMCADFAGFHTSITISLSVVLALLIVGIGASLLFPGGDVKPDENDAGPPNTPSIKM